MYVGGTKCNTTDSQHDGMTGEQRAMLAGMLSTSPGITAPVGGSSSVGDGTAEGSPLRAGRGPRYPVAKPVRSVHKAGCVYLNIYPNEINLTVIRTYELSQLPVVQVKSSYGL